MAFKKDCVTTTLYIPNEVYEDLTRYMEQYVGTTYGRNSIIVQAIQEFLASKQEPSPAV